MYTVRPAAHSPCSGLVAIYGVHVHLTIDPGDCLQYPSLLNDAAADWMCTWCFHGAVSSVLAAYILPCPPSSLNGLLLVCTYILHTVHYYSSYRHAIILRAYERIVNICVCMYLHVYAVLCC